MRLKAQWVCVDQRTTLYKSYLVLSNKNSNLPPGTSTVSELWAAFLWPPGCGTEFSPTGPRHAQRLWRSVKPSLWTAGPGCPQGQRTHLLYSCSTYTSTACLHNNTKTTACLHNNTKTTACIHGSQKYQDNSKSLQQYQANSKSSKTITNIPISLHNNTNTTASLHNNTNTSYILL